MVDASITREERYLEYLTGNYKGNVPKPVTRRERYLYELCLKGMGGEISPEEIQSAVNDYLDKNPVKPGATTEQAQQIEQNKTDIASLKTETSSLKESISTKITKFYASSQGETHLADSDNGKIMDMMLYGKSEQKQYSGKNLLPTTMYSDSYVTNGVTFINNGDGSVTVSGTATDTTYFTLWGYNALEDKGVLQGITPGDILYVSDCFLQQTNSKEVVNTISNGSTQFKASTTTMYVAIKVDEGETVNKTFYPQIEKGSESTPYEPYTGGIPSPNPSYPQEIKSVVNPTVKVCGKNLWDNIKTLSSGNIEQKNGTYIATTNTMQVDVAPDSSGNRPLFLKANNTYTFSLKTTINVSNNRYVCLKYTNGESKNINFINNNVINFVPERDVEKIGFVLYGSVTGDKAYDVQLEKGSKATDFEPYHEQTVTLPYTLNAIPVSSGGNVTIDGQQYASDYVDVERGKLVRNITKIKKNTSKLKLIDNKMCIQDDVGVDELLSMKNNAPFLCEILTYKSWANNVYDGFLYFSTLDSSKVEYYKSMNLDFYLYAILKEPKEIDLTSEEIAAFKALATYYPTTNISVNSEQLDGYTVFNYPVSMENGWNYVKQQIGDTREYIYDMDARIQDTDLQAAEAYVNSEYAVVLTELEV